MAAVRKERQAAAEGGEAGAGRGPGGGRGVAAGDAAGRAGLQGALRGLRHLHGRGAEPSARRSRH